MIRASGRNLGLGSYGVLGAVRTQFFERHDVAHALPLTKDSNGYCPICGYWSISTNIILNDKTGEKGDKCLICDTIFDASGLLFIDSQMCTCGHPKEYHDKNVSACIKGKELSGCNCEKYEPTEVTVKVSKI
jgi:formate dehydrogenase maturation protein FdhE